MTTSRDLLTTRRQVLSWGTGLAVVVLSMVAFSGVTGNGFVNYDDDDYVTANTHVLAGLNAASAWWALTTWDVANWHPLTWLSLQLDAQLFGSTAAGYHVTSVLLHTVNALLLYVVFFQMTGAAWRSGWLAAFFAVHPVHVESVAWVAERKDVLSTLFWLLTMWAYLAYTRRPGMLGYILVCCTFALGLMAKPMVVTLPFVLLLVDWWPLDRLRLHPNQNEHGPRTHTGWLLIEKLPLIVLAAASCVVTILAQQQGGAVESLERLPASARLNNALTAYVLYLGKTFWPMDLAVFYPLPLGGRPAWHGLTAGLLLALVTTFVCWRRRVQPYLVVGWFWYLGTLVPVIGLVQVGQQAMADRYTYVPLIGVFLMLVWSAHDVTAWWKWPTWQTTIVGLIALTICTVLTRLQVSYWQDSITLWHHTLRVTGPSGPALLNLGFALLQTGQPNEAARCFDALVRFNPRYPGAYPNLASALLRLGNAPEAERQCRLALAILPEDPEMYCKLGMALAAQGETDEAVRQYREALQRNPGHTPSHTNLAALMARQGKLDEAIQHFREALRSRPNDAEAHFNLAAALGQHGELGEAAAEFRRAARLRPAEPTYRWGLVVALAQLGETKQALAESQAIQRGPTWAQKAREVAWALATRPVANERNGAVAVPLAEELWQSSDGKQPALLDVLAAAYAEQGRFDEATAAVRGALLLAVQQPELTKQLQDRLRLYEGRSPYRQPAPNS